MDSRLDYTIPLVSKPPLVQDKATLIFHYGRKVNRSSEEVLGTRLMTDRPLFGECYRHLSPDLFDSFSQLGGVVVASCIPSIAITPKMSYPGDIDMLVIPYDNHELLLHRSLAIELKIVRASFQNQAKSPNKFGFSQASSLLAHGFPYAAVAHLIISDDSPTSAWQKTHVTQIIDGKSGAVEEPREYFTDLMPQRLIDRTYGRLKSRCNNRRLGLISCYLGDAGKWQPEGRAAKPNPKPSPMVIEAIGALYSSHSSSFFDIPRFDPA